MTRRRRTSRREKPRSVIIRVYNVGFGDCFLLTFNYSRRKKRHILIDFGSSAKPRGARSDHFKRVAKNIKEVCGGKLHVLVATHRHRDHLSGFALGSGAGSPGRVIRSLEPDYVIQPWTEDPSLPQDATAPPDRSDRLRGFMSSLRKMQDIAGVAASEARWMRAHKMAVADDLARDIEVYGESGISNLSAIRNLRTMAKKRSLYVSYNRRLPLARLLPGVKLRVLGPPTLEEFEEIESQRTEDANEFWHLQKRAFRYAGDSRLMPFPDAGAYKMGRYPAEVHPYIRRLQAIRGQQILAIVRSLDDALNNTSLILVFEVGGQVLVFSGDAQIENWLYCLDHAREKTRNRRLVRKATVYKVGHHGSLNATPKRLLWNEFRHKSRRRSDAQRLRTLLSTMADQHGHEESNTEVPREPLVEALGSYSNLMNTQSMSADEQPAEIEIPL
jgi:hypothetical protein